MSKIFILDNILIPNILSRKEKDISECSHYILPQYQTVDIDDIEDFKLARKLLFKKNR
tara:strand:+ start:168 stop:341 length:174 start_codon:yes stop_codon:yes gene_type:complete